MLKIFFTHFLILFIFFLGAGEETENRTTQTVEKKSWTESIHFDPKGQNTVGYLYIGGHEQEINESTWLYIKQGLAYYKKHPPIFIILELNTPGGEVFAAQKIADALKEIDIQSSIPVVSFINNWAISAGAMLAYSTRVITTVKDASMGAAEPVYAGESGKMESAPEKVNSALRSDFASRAGFFDRSELLAEAMVDKDMILVKREGKIIQLKEESQIRLSGLDPDIIISSKGKLLTLSGPQMIDEGIADLLLPPEKIPEITAEEKQAGKWPGEKMLLFHAPFFSTIPEVRVEAYQMDWKTQFFVLLATPLVSSLLFTCLIIGAYMEFSNPGLTLPGSIAITSLFLIIISTFSLQIAGWLEVIMLLSGLVFILTELFVLPTFGLLAVVGGILFFAGLFAMLLPGLNTAAFEWNTETWNAAGYYLLNRLMWLCGSFVLSLVIIASLARFFLPKSCACSRFVLSGGEQDASKGFIAGDNPLCLPQKGATGEVFSGLRPSGKIIVKNCIYDAISTGDYLDAGEPIIVERLEGSVIFVALQTLKKEIKT